MCPLVVMAVLNDKPNGLKSTTSSQLPLKASAAKCTKDPRRADGWTEMRLNHQSVSECEPLVLKPQVQEQAACQQQIDCESSSVMQHRNNEQSCHLCLEHLVIGLQFCLRSICLWGRHNMQHCNISQLLVCSRKATLITCCITSNPMLSYVLL